MKILVGVTGSVAAIHTGKLVDAILANDPSHQVKVISTQRGLYFFDRAKVTSEVLTDKDEWTDNGYHKGDVVPHIDLGQQWADILVIAPLSADTLSDMAHGKADKFLTSIVLAWPREKKMILAPAMNTNMWTNPIVQNNLASVCQTYRVQVINPVEGMLACGVRGIGAMARHETIIAALGALI